MLFQYLLITLLLSNFICMCLSFRVCNPCRIIDKYHLLLDGSGKILSMQLVVPALSTPQIIYQCLHLHVYMCVSLCVFHVCMCSYVQSAAHQVRKPRWNEGSNSWLKMAEGVLNSSVCVCVPCAYAVWHTYPLPYVLYLLTHWLR